MNESYTRLENPVSSQPISHSHYSSAFAVILCEPYDSLTVLLKGTEIRPCLHTVEQKPYENLQEQLE